MVHIHGVGPSDLSKATQASSVSLTCQSPAPLPAPGSTPGPAGLLAPPSRPGSESGSTSSEWGHGPAGRSRDSESAGRLAGQGRPSPGAMSRNLRTALIFGGFVSLIGAAFYPIYFRPLMRLEEYQKEQTINRAGIIQEDVQPPGLKVWSDPFGRK
ncbi:small integral membrane protein 20 [Choloepus didactylus]|uniref:small integral membrane protein 20 n=1 Tax=Choloepus didactylus TaxID=27675 RepID=UPI0018A0312C|nr:small integral membrane protein 20 [Choloepus didactylus]